MKAFFKKFLFTSRAFTLIELMVVIGLSLLFVGAASFYNRASDKMISVYREEALIVSKLQEAKSMAVSTYLGEETNPGCGWGLHFDAVKNKILIFKDVPLQGLGEFERCKSFGGALYSDNDVVLESLSLKESQLNLGQNDELDILFVPPNPTVYFYPSSLEEAVITLSSPRVENFSLSIRVNRFGQISAD
ncbi:MAG: type II secretion system GspH family protein [Patescibacteria group bacterium]|nr:type II secretion system GspH family protein [Patescibacteria group bacterium]